MAPPARRRRQQRRASSSLLHRVFGVALTRALVLQHLDIEDVYVLRRALGCISVRAVERERGLRTGSARDGVAAHALRKALRSRYDWALASARLPQPPAPALLAISSGDAEFVAHVLSLLPAPPDARDWSRMYCECARVGGVPVLAVLRERQRHAAIDTALMTHAVPLEAARHNNVPLLQYCETALAGVQQRAAAAAASGGGGETEQWPLLVPQRVFGEAVAADAEQSVAWLCQRGCRVMECVLVTAARYSAHRVIGFLFSDAAAGFVQSYDGGGAERFGEAVRRRALFEALDNAACFAALVRGGCVPEVHVHFAAALRAGNASVVQRLVDEWTPAVAFASVSPPDVRRALLANADMCRYLLRTRPPQMTFIRLDDALREACAIFADIDVFSELLAAAAGGDDGVSVHTQMHCTLQLALHAEHHRYNALAILRLLLQRHGFWHDRPRMLELCTGTAHRALSTLFLELDSIVRPFDRASV